MYATDRQTDRHTLDSMIALYPRLLGAGHNKVNKQSHYTYKTSAPAPDKEHERGGEVDDGESSGCQQDEMIVDTERQSPRIIVTDDCTVHCLGVTSSTPAVISRTCHLQRIYDSTS